MAKSRQTEGEGRITPNRNALLDHPLPEFISPRTLADLLGVSPRTLQRWHQTRRGPVRCKVGHLIRYRVEAVRDWLTSNETTPVVRTGRTR